MKIESVSQKYFSVTIKAIITVAVIASGILLSFVINISDKHEKLSLKDIASTSHSYQRNISEKISILANSQLLLDYIRSGPMTRESLELDMDLVFSTIQDETISGVSILDNNDESIYIFGSKTKDFVEVKICYLDNVINYEFGRCAGSIGIYFNLSNILKKLKEMNPQIEACNSCNFQFFDSLGDFGSLKIKRNSIVFLPIAISNPGLSWLYASIVFFLLLSAILFVFFHKALNKISHDYIYVPIKNLVAQIEQGKVSSLDDINIQEIKFVAEKLNQYIENLEQRQKLESQALLGDLATQVAHDIRSPVSVLEMLLENETTLEIKEKELFQATVKRINEIANLLLQKRIDLKSNLSLSKILTAIKREKIYEFSNEKLEIQIESFEDEIFSDLLQKIDFQSIISNIINNSVEACRSIGHSCLVVIKVRTCDNYIEIELQDNGPGFPEGFKKSIFKNEFTTGKNQGNGVGLFSANKLINSIGGTLEASNHKGAKIIISLPLMKTS